MAVNLLYLSTSFLWWQAVAGLLGGEIEPRVAHEFMAHVATQRGLAAFPQHRHPRRAQPVAPVRSCHSGRPRRPPRRCTAQAPHREQGHPGSHTREEKRPHRITCLVMRRLPADPLFASWSWPRHIWMLLGTS